MGFCHSALDWFVYINNTPISTVQLWELSVISPIIFLEKGQANNLSWYLGNICQTTAS